MPPKSKRAARLPLTNYTSEHVRRDNPTKHVFKQLREEKDEALAVLNHSQAAAREVSGDKIEDAGDECSHVLVPVKSCHSFGRCLIPSRRRRLD